MACFEEVYVISSKRPLHSSGKCAIIYDDLVWHCIACVQLFQKLLGRNVLVNNRKASPKERVKRFRVKHWRIISLYLVIYDILAVNMAYLAALWLRFDCQFSAIPAPYLSAFLQFVPAYTVLSVVVFAGLRLYNSIWRFASYNEFSRVAVSSVVTGVLQVVGTGIILSAYQVDALGARMPFSYYFVGTLLQFLAVLLIRFSYRFVLLFRKKARAADTTASNVLLVGAGAAGQMILRDVNSAKEVNERICCIIDDNSNKWGRYIDGVPVVGGRDSILESVKKYNIQKIFLAIPSATAEQRRDILDICKETGCELKNLPGMYQFVTGEITASAMREVAVEDLLGREPIKVNMDEIFQQLRGKTILVTGGGGSIGSELCRQVAGHEPGLLIIFDVYENNAYEIEQELRAKYPELNLKVLIGSVRDSRRINSVFATYKPDLVYHAAAHKHVPLMEASPCEAIKNNVIGTYKTAYAAMIHGCRRFVLISTDKAVNPTNIMGASKRLCEMVIQSFDRAVKTGSAKSLPMLFTHYADELDGLQQDEIGNSFTTEFVAVRFGNVLGSNGSVIPLFKKQIAKGGPVTVTHPDIIRYFMTIPEAVSLVMQAGTYAGGGEIFVLDMGAPVKIDTLARNLIKLSGLKPDVDIKVEYTGLRPGEKLFEEKLMAEEGLQKTKNELIHIGNPIPFDTDAFLVQLQKLMDAAYHNDENICKLVEQMVSTYHPAPNGSEDKGETYDKLRRETVGVK